VRQLIARIEDELHERLKARAAAERRSLNSLVRELLVQGLPAGDGRQRVRMRAEAAGLRVVPRLDRQPPSRKAAIAATRGAGRVASEALAAERARR
jgi:plasmid stability protein